MQGVPAKDMSADWAAQSPEYFSVRTRLIELAQRSQADSETDSIPSGAKIGNPRSWTEPRRRQGFNVAKRTTRMLSKHAAGGGDAARAELALLRLPTKIKVHETFSQP